MTVNYNILAGLAAPRIVGQIAPSQSQGDDLGSIMSGLQGLVGGIKQASNPIQNSNTYGAMGAAQGLAPGAQMNQPVNPMQPVQAGGMNQGALGQIGQTHSIFDNAMKQMGLSEGNPTLRSYLNKANPNLDPSVTPWCAGYVGSVLNASGLKGTGSLAAKSYLNYGNPTNQPQRGDIVVFNDMTGRNDPNHGHVGFVDHIDPKTGMVYTLGGNQGNAVSIKPYPMSAVAGFRQPPTGQQVQQFAAQNNIQSPAHLASITSPSNGNNLQAAMAGIAHVESGDSKNPYGLISKPSRNGDQAYGKYQIMGNNIPSWSKEAIGRPVTKQEFLNNPDIQEKVAAFQIKKNLDQYGNLDDTFSTWFSGRPVAKAGNAKDVYGTTVPDYIKKAREGVSAFLGTQSSPTPSVPSMNPAQAAPVPANYVMQPQRAQSATYPILGTSPQPQQPMGVFSNNPQIDPVSITPNNQNGGINWGLLSSIISKNT